MRVLILTNNDVGLYKFRKELLEALLENNEVYISLPNGSYVKDMQKMGCHFIQTDFDRKGTNPVKDLRLLKKYRSIIRENKPDIVLTYTIKPNVYGGIVCQTEKIPYVANITGLGSSLENGGILQLITKILYRTGLRKAQNVFFQNEANQRFMIENGIVGKKNELIPGSGVNLEMYHYLVFPVDKPIGFVFVGRLMKQKGISLYLSAAKRIRQKYPDTVFHVCGPDEDDYLDRVKKMEASGEIVYHGMVEDMRNIYKQIQCIIHPSYYAEGMSNVLLEAAACGRAIITTDRPGCKETVNDQESGYLVKRNDLEDLIDKIEEFISLNYEKRREMGRKGREKAEREFDRKIVVDHYLRELEKCQNR
ncbi:MAG: glycosyltransferase family 4 protein [Erysipelotrichaceae bacterium]|nr:glycosyltransferase family 4 protein [Erysipelotrichaceae bacterium]